MKITIVNCLVFIAIVVHEATALELVLQPGNQTCCNHEVTYVCGVTSSASLTWTVDTSGVDSGIIPVIFRNDSNRNMPINRGDNDEFQFALTGAENNPEGSPLFDFNSTLVVTANQEQNGSIFRCTDAVTTAEEPFILNSSSEVIDGTQELECTCNLNNSTVCLKLKLREMLCGWDGLVQFNITINDRIEVNATIATTNTIEYCIPISMLPETPENYVFDVFATNACGETSNKESFNVNCAGPCAVPPTSKGDTVRFAPTVAGVILLLIIYTVFL